MRGGVGVKSIEVSGLVSQLVLKGGDLTPTPLTQSVSYPLQIETPNKRISGTPRAEKDKNNKWCRALCY